MTQPRLTLILGGARSGKSTHGESLADGHQGPLVYIATAQAYDGEMTTRIAAHVARRGAVWRTVEEPLDLPGAIMAADKDGSFTLVDCITLWLTNVLLGEHDVAARTSRLLEVVGGCTGPLVLVSNEVGLGIVPENALARRFRDEAGMLNQKLAQVAERVVLVTAGLPLQLK
ncbi:MAG: bifunctional adenosylcobinamide kinase/adenosylcobinamide-phosphate guanylyltransferase [Alphaproteobacteria bacterium]|nr:bifunctional adenosylcobinamide kinase/adenosylcobinamide-phosphate guanylyltransferase [Alphaproteobacteria bacterium]